MGDNHNFTALDWVVGEIRETLTQARQALESYVENPLDTSRLRFCLTYIHQVHGSLKMVEFFGGALLAEEMEALVQALIDNQIANRSEGYEVLMRAILQLPVYLEQIQMRRRDDPAVLLSLLNDLRAVRNGPLLTESRFFNPDLQGGRRLAAQRVAMPPEQFRAAATKLRQMYQQAVTALIRGINTETSLSYLTKICTRLQQLAQGSPRQPLWDVALGLTEVLEADAIQLSVAVKYLLRQLDREIKLLCVQGPAGLNTPCADELLRNLLYYIGQAEPCNAHLRGLHEHYALARALPETAVQELISVPDQDTLRAVVTALNDEIAMVKSALERMLTGTDADASGEARQVLKRIADTLAVLGAGDLRRQVQAQIDLLQAAGSDAGAVVTQVADEVMALERTLTLLCSRPHYGVSSPAQLEIDQAQRSVVREARNGLEQAKDAIVEYIASQWNREHLQHVPHFLDEVRGGLSMIPLPRAANVLAICSRFITERLIEQDQVPAWSTLDTLADAIASVEFYLERLVAGGDDDNELLLGVAEDSLASLGYAVVDGAAPAAKTAAVDAGAVDPAAIPVVRDSLPGLSVPPENQSPDNDGVASEREPQPPLPDAEADSATPAPPHLAPEAFTPAPGAAVAEAELAEADIAETEAAEPIATAVVVSGDGAAAIPAAPADDDDIDEEIIEIFIEEAGEVLDTIASFFPQWAADFTNHEALIEFRRAFHTLKGSGRMVGANAIGELAWSVENMLNRVLDNSIRPDQHHVNFIERVCTLLPDMVEAFRLRQPNPHADAAARYQGWGESLARGVIPEELPEIPATAASAAAGADDNGEEDWVLWEIFGAEALTHLQMVEQFIADMEASAPLYCPPSDEMQRALHTLKGSAHMADITPIAQLATPLERFVKELRTYQVNVDEDILQLIRDGVTYTKEALIQIKEGSKVEIAKLDQFQARVAELKDLSVGPLIRLREAENSEQKPVDPRLLSIFMAEDMKLLLDADSTLAQWQQNPADLTPLQALMAELTTLAAGAEQANLPAMAQLSRQLEQLHQALINGRLSGTDPVCEALLQGHEALLDMVDAVAAGQNLQVLPAPLQTQIDTSLAAISPPDPDLPAATDLTHTDGATPEASAPEVSASEISEPDVIALSSADIAALPSAVDLSGVNGNESDAVDAGQVEADVAEANIIETDDIEADDIETDDIEISSAEADLSATDRVEADLAEVVMPAGYIADMAAAGTSPAAPELADITPEVIADIYAAVHAYSATAEVNNDAADRDAGTMPAPAEPDRERGHEVSDLSADTLATDFFAADAAAESDFEPETEAETETETEPDTQSEQVVPVADPFTAVSGAAVATQDSDSVSAVCAADEEILPRGEEPPAAMADAANNTVALLHPLPAAAPDIDAADVLDPEIVDIFLEEADELLADVDEAIHAWETDWNDDSWQESLQRVLHTLKGGARLAGLMTLGDLAHDFETHIVSTSAVVDQTFFQQLHRYQDQIISALERARAGFNGGVPLAASAPVAAPLPVAPLNAVFAPAASIDIADSATPGGQAAAPDSHPEPGVVAAVYGATLPAAEVVPPLQAAAGQVAEILPFVAKTGPQSEAPRPVSGPALPKTSAPTALNVRRQAPQEVVKVSAELLEQLVNLAGETSISRGQVEEQLNDMGYTLEEMDATLQRLQEQLRRLDIETQAQILFRKEQLADDENFDPLEMDRYSQLQQLSRSLIESASDLQDLKLTLADKTRDTETLLLQQSRINTELQEGLMRSRMVPFSRLVPRLRRIVRQVAGELDKQVGFEMENVEGEMDRSVMERMVAPLEHMLRNAVDHGIEAPAERLARHKPEAGTITLSLGREGGDVVLRLRDDGRGINLARVREKAIERGLMSAESNLSERDIMQFILQSGFSTADSISQISGRGVGMDVVHSEIKQLGGSMLINSVPGQGTEFVIHLPFTVSVNRALMVRMGEEAYAIPLNTIEGIVRVSPFELEHYYQSDSARFEYAGEEYQIRYLGAMLNSDIRPKLDGQTMPMPVILVRSGNHAVAMQVDQLMGSREIVVKSLGAQFSAVVGISGATVMGDGSVVVILDPHAMIRREAALLHDSTTTIDSTATEIRVDKTRTVMVVDDSVTVRKVTTRFLEREGYNVITAKDGVEALQILQDHIPDVMLLDIEMPRMDGFEVAKNIRSSSIWREIPIIMITSRTGQKHRDHALSLGVNTYMGKPFQEEQLLDNIRNLTGENIGSQAS